MLWRLITHHEYPDDALQWYLNHSLIALGWGDIGDLQNQQINCQTDISVLCNQVYGPGNTGECGRCLWDFWQVTIPRQSRGLSFMSRSKRLIGVANAAPPSGTT